MSHVARISTNANEVVFVPMEKEDEREVTVIFIDGVRYHFERIARHRLISDYKVDGDPNYQPQADAEGFCYILAPFSE